MKTYLDPLDAVALAIFDYEGGKIHDRNVRNNNPGNLRASTIQHVMDPGGYCVFGSMAEGWLALREELLSKFTGHNEHGITPFSTLLDLFKVYAPSSDGNAPERYAAYVAVQLGNAYDVPVTSFTTLGEVLKLKGE